MEVALEAGADDVSTSDMIHEIITSPDAFETVRDALTAAGIEPESADIRQVAENEIMLDAHHARKAMKLVDALEDHDDIDAVYSNFDVPDDVMAELAKE